MKRTTEVKFKENNGSASYVTLAVFMLTGVVLYTILPPLFTRQQDTKRTSFTAIPEVPHDITSADENSSGREHVIVAASTDDTVSIKEDKEDILLVHTGYGPIRGTQRAGVRVFHGVRFAQSPLNDLRWKEPQPVKPWGPDIYDASWIRPGCPQKCQPSLCPANGTSEDCLYMEIFAPFVNKSNKEESGSEQGLPVLIYVHGGGFRDMAATTPVFDGAYIAGRGNMIVIFPEYRIGSLGFLFTGTSSDQAVGNFGLMDQRLAIEWVGDNIRAFGGDPNKITLAGHSAGALSVVLHLTTPETARLFRYVMLSSIPLTTPYRSVAKSINRGHNLAKQLGCFPSKLKEPDMACLRNKSVQDIRNIEEFMAANSSPALGGLLDSINPWGPVIDGDFVKSSPLESMIQFADTMSSDPSRIKPMMMGLTTGEAYLFMKEISQYKSMGRLYPVILSSVTGIELDDLDEFYPIHNTNDISEDIVSVLTDFMFRCPLRAVQRRLVTSQVEDDKRSDRSPVFKLWTYLWHPPMVGNIPADMEFCRGKTCHGAELPFLFKSSNATVFQVTGRQLKLSNAVIDYVANFVATGDPNTPAEADNGSSRSATDKEMTDGILTETRGGNSDTAKHLQRRSVVKSHPHWQPVTHTSGFSKEPTWLFNNLNFLKSSRLKMAKQSIIKGKQCDIWDETDYKFPQLFGS